MLMLSNVARGRSGRRGGREGGGGGDDDMTGRGRGRRLG